MAKKILKDPSEGNKNLGRGVGALLNPVDNQKKEKEKNKTSSFDTENVTSFTISIPTDMFEKLKYEVAKEKKATMRHLILEAIQEHYKL